MIFYTLFILRKDMGGPENGNFPLLYVVKMSLRSLKTPLRNIKMAPIVIEISSGWLKRNKSSNILLKGLFL